MRKFLYWFPRILAIAFILFLSLFALDMFDSSSSVLTQFLGFLIHLTPNFILLIILLIAWKNEKLGGILFIICSFVFFIFFNNFFARIVFVPILLLIGILFLVNGYKKKMLRIR